MPIQGADAARRKEIEVEEVYGSKEQTPNRGMNGMQSLCAIGVVTLRST
jgi:hypothetical protein